jgi:hypothetical protein
MKESKQHQAIQPTQLVAFKLSGVLVVVSGALVVSPSLREFVSLNYRAFREV